MKWELVYICRFCPSVGEGQPCTMSAEKYECRDRGRFINRCGTSLTTAYIFLLACEESSIAERQKCVVKVLRKKEGSRHSDD